MQKSYQLAIVLRLSLQQKEKMQYRCELNIAYYFITLKRKLKLTQLKSQKLSEYIVFFEVLKSISIRKCIFSVAFFFFFEVSKQKYIVNYKACLKFLIATPAFENW